MVLVDVSSAQYVPHDILPDSDANDDVAAIWQPDLKGLIVVRRAADSPDMSPPQLYSLSLATGAATPLVVDFNYTNGNVMFDPTGEVLLFQRFSQGQPGARPDIWTYNFK